MTKTTLKELLTEYKAEFVSVQPNGENLTISHVKGNVANEDQEVDTDADKVYVKVKGKPVAEVK